MDEVEEYKYSPSSPSAGQPFFTETGAPGAHNVALDALHRASSDTLTANCTASDRVPDASSVGPVPSSGVRGNLHSP